MEGNVRLAWTEWRMLGHNTYGQATVTLDDMASSVSRVKPLGSYRVVFQAEGEAGTIDPATTSQGAAAARRDKGTGVAGIDARFDGTAQSPRRKHERIWQDC